MKNKNSCVRGAVLGVRHAGRLIALVSFVWLYVYGPQNGCVDDYSSSTAAARTAGW